MRLSNVSIKKLKTPEMILKVKEMLKLLEIF